MDFYTLICEMLRPIGIKGPFLQQFEDIRNGVLPHYLTNDSAHQIEHADEVAFTALKLVLNSDQLVKSLPDLAQYSFGDLVAMSLYAAYTHDMFCDERRNHHELAFEFVLYQFPWWMPTNIGSNQKLRVDVANAVREHRASWKHGYSSQFSELIACADRGEPNLVPYVARSYKYARDRQKLNRAEALIYAIDHINGKFGYEGTAKLPEVWCQIFADELADLKCTIDRCNRTVVEFINTSEGAADIQRLGITALRNKHDWLDNILDHVIMLD